MNKILFSKSQILIDMNRFYL